MTISPIGLMTWQRAACLAVVLLMPPRDVGAQVPKPDDSRAVRVNVEMNRSTYRVGGPIAVRLALRNVSSDTVSFVARPPAHQVRLQVYDPEGHLVSPAGGLSQRLMGSTHLIRLEAGQELTLSWRKQKWINLQDWGYDLRQPGRYSVVAVPRVGGVNVELAHRTELSNEVTFTIEP